MILKCTCENEGQDRLHGKQNRVMNKTRIKCGDKYLYRCTVCGKERQR